MQDIKHHNQTPKTIPLPHVFIFKLPYIFTSIWRSWVIHKLEDFCVYISGECTSIFMLSKALVVERLIIFGVVGSRLWASAPFKLKKNAIIFIWSYWAIQKLEALCSYHCGSVCQFSSCLVELLTTFGVGGIQALSIICNQEHQHFLSYHNFTSIWSYWVIQKLVILCSYHQGSVH